MLKELARGVYGVFRPVVVLLRWLCKAIAWLFSEEGTQVAIGLVYLCLLAFLAFLVLGCLWSWVQTALA